MSPDPPGVAAPEDPAAAPGANGRPRFREDVERVDATDRVKVAVDDPSSERRPSAAVRRQRLRARKVRRIVRHIDPWSVLKISVLFFLSLFLIICVASTLLWNAARTAGTVDSVESFITSLGFGNCEAIDGGSAATPSTTSTIDGSGDQLGGVAGTAPGDTVAPAPEPASTVPNSDGKCAEGQQLVGGFKFEDVKIFEAFALGGVVLVLAGAASSVVMALLFNLISDLTGGVRVTVLEEELPPRGEGKSGSPVRRRRG